MPPTHYETLGISKDATEKEIKQAFRSMSMKYHPDKVLDKSKEEQEIAHRRMQEINSANDVLSDPEQRRGYDMEQQGGHPMQGFPPGFHPMQGFPPGFHFGGHADIFEMFFGGGGAGPNIEIRGMPNMFFQKRVLKPEPIEKDLHITIKQSYEGAVVQVEIERVIRHENTQTVETELLIVNIPQGIDDGDTIVLQNKGHVVASVAGDVKLNIHVKNDTEFRRTGLDLYFTKTITLKEALCGFKFKIEHLNGNQMSLNVNVVIFTGAKQVIKNLGMVKGDEVGNFILEFVVAFPESLTPEQKTQISDIL
jgi:curved DNA-binding protein